MALRIAFLVALCVAQALAFQPLRDASCSNLAGEIAQSFDEAVNGIDEVRDTVSMAALDAYAQNSNLEIVIACFRAQRDSYKLLGQRISGMIKDASREMRTELRNRAEKYAKLMEVPLRTIAVTLRELPETVYNYLQQYQFSKAVEAIKNARAIVQENSRIVGELFEQMVSEIPELADKAGAFAMEIREESRRGREAIRKAFGRCIEEGGPQEISQE